MSIGIGCARAMLIIFNFIFWLSGAAIMGTGIWLLVDKNIATYSFFVEFDTADPYFTYATYILIGFGVLVFVVGFCGCCGAIRGSKCMLGVYIFFLLIIMAGELAAGIMAAVYQNVIQDEMQLHLKKMIREDYNRSAVITKSWDIVQIQLLCCGSSGADDYNVSYWRNATSDPAITVPTSCCEMRSPDINVRHVMDYAQCQARVGRRMHQEGCYTKLMIWIKDHLVIIIGVGCGIAGLEVFGLIFAICLCRHTEKDDDY